MNEQKFEINSKIDKLEKWNNRGNFILFFEKRQFFIISCFVLVQFDNDVLGGRIAFWWKQMCIAVV